VKLEHCLFLSLVLVAAIVTGSTLCVAANFPYIMEQAEKAQTLQLTPTPEANEKIARASMADAPAGISRGSSSGADVMVITAAEKEQIINMLNSLGMSSDEQLSSFIKGFQEKHCLDATGLLDSKTLHFIIEEAKLVKVEQGSRQASLN